MSFTETNHIKGQRKTALKLINKYADSYNLLIQENRILKAEIKDLRMNIQINKEIINGFFSQKQLKDKISLLLSKYQEENHKLYSQNENLNKELQILQSKFNYNEQTLSELICKENEEFEKFKRKIFVLEQLNKKKDDIINYQKKKIDNFKEEDFSYIEKEVYILEPSQAIIQINDELLLYKQIYENFAINIQDTQKCIKKYEIELTELQNENLKLREQFRMQILNANKERETLIRALKNEKLLSNNNRIITENGNIISKSMSKIFNKEIANEGNLISKLHYIKDKKFENEEFVEIIKIAGLSQSEFEKMAKNKLYIKLTDTIEMIYRLLKDKTYTLNLLNKENESLTAKNFKLNKENMKLFKENTDLKQENKKLKQNSILNGMKTKEDSIVYSKSNNYQSVENTIKVYKKYIKNQLSENAPDLANEISNSNIENSYHDSIIYTRNIKDDPEIIDESNGKDPSQLKDDSKRNKNCMTIGSVSSSEFREGCQGIESFISTIRRNNNILDNNLELESKGKITKNESFSELEVYNIKETYI